MQKSYQATVTGVYGAYFHVRLDDPEVSKDLALLSLDGDKAVVMAKPSGRLRLQGGATKDKREHLLAIGDVVQVEMSLETGRETIASIISVEERSNVIQRATFGRVQNLAANIDLVVVVSSFEQPAYNPGFIDRVLCECELAHVPVVLVINKIDLAAAQNKDFVEADLEIFASLGYTCFRESFIQGISSELRGLLKDKRTLLVGQSGVGKSTLLNKQAQKAIQRVNTLGSIKKGRHTTVNPVLYKMADGGELIDVPGLREFGLQHLPALQLCFGFREFRSIECRFDDCLHRGEAGCGVSENHENHKESNVITSRRYKSYLSILESIDEEFKPRKGDYWRGIRK